MNVIKCKLCGIEYSSYRSLGNHLRTHKIKCDEYYDRFLKINENEGICPICGKGTKFRSLSYGYSEFCGCSCAQLSPKTQQKHMKTCEDLYGDVYYTNREKYSETMAQKTDEEKQEIVNKTRRTKKLKYNDENYNNKEKIAETNLKRYGTKCPVNFENQKKARQTKLERYGNEAYQNIEKIKQTKLEKYGDENYNNREKCKNTMLERYGVEHNWNRCVLRDKTEKNKQEKIRQFEIENNCIYFSNALKIYGQSFRRVVDKSKIMLDGNNNKFISNDYFSLLLSNKKIFKSSVEESVYNYISSFTDNAECWINTKKIITPLELDLFYPEFNVAVEINGDYFHGSHNEEDYKNRYRHYLKYNLCKDKGIDLIQLFDSDWTTNLAVCKSVLSAAFRYCKKQINIMDCEITEIEYETVIKFAKNNYLYPKEISVNRCYLGVFYEHELISIIQIHFIDGEKVVENIIYKKYLSVEGDVLYYIAEYLGVDKILIFINNLIDNIKYYTNKDLQVVYKYPPELLEKELFVYNAGTDVYEYFKEDR